MATRGYVTESDGAAITRLLYERDQARREAAELQAAADVAQRRSDKAMSRIVARDEFEDAVRAALDVLHARVRSFKERAKVEGTAEDRFKVAMVARAVLDRRASVETALHRVHAVPTVEWVTYKHEITVAVAEIARDIESGIPRKLQDEENRNVRIGRVKVLG